MLTRERFHRKDLFSRGTSINAGDDDDIGINECINDGLINIMIVLYRFMRLLLRLTITQSFRTSDVLDNATPLGYS